MDYIKEKMFQFFSFVTNTDSEMYTIFNVIIIRPGRRIIPSKLNHEKIHVAQYKETLYIGGCIILFFDYIVKIIYYRDREKAYRNLLFEKEAFRHQNELNYLDRRKCFAWLRSE